MTDFRIENYRMPAAYPGVESSLPPLHSLRGVNTSPDIEVDESVPLEDRKYINYGIDTGILPHGMLDNYDRVRKDRYFKAVVLENEILKAQLELGISE